VLSSSRSCGVKAGGPLRRRSQMKRGGPLRFRSKKTAKKYRDERVPLVKELAEEAGICPVIGCTNVANSPHEPLTRARGGSITDPGNVVMVCWPCNQALTLEPDWGYEQGLLIHSWDKPGDAA
jgi:hypothetical protein